MAISKVVYGGETLIDLTQDSVEASKLLKGTTAHGADGEEVVGEIESLSAKSYTPTTEDQTIASGQYLSGVQTIKGDANLVPSEIRSGTTLFNVTGTFTGDANATDAEILDTKTAYVKGVKVTGKMPNKGAVSGTISTKEGSYTVPQGYHDGGGKVTIASTEQEKIIPENIRQGITLLGVTGTMSGTEGANAESPTVTPTKDGFTVIPSDGYNYLAQVTVNPIPYVVSENSAGGQTVTIA